MADSIISAVSVPALPASGVDTVGLLRSVLQVTEDTSRNPLVAALAVEKVLSDSVRLSERVNLATEKTGSAFFAQLISQEIDAQNLQIAKLPESSSPSGNFRVNEFPLNSDFSQGVQVTSTPSQFNQAVGISAYQRVQAAAIPTENNFESQVTSFYDNEQQVGGVFASSASLNVGADLSTYLNSDFAAFRFPIPDFIVQSPAESAIVESSSNPIFRTDFSTSLLV